MVGDWNDYKSEGLDMTVYFFEQNKYVRLGDVSSENLRNEICKFLGFRNMNNVSDSNREYYNEFIFIFNDILQKRRTEKIKKIKDKING